MSGIGDFGNFLLGAARGLEQGVEAGEYVAGAIDRKKVRDTGKKVARYEKASDNMAAAGGYDRATNRGAAPIDPTRIAPLDPGKIAAPTTMQPHMPTQMQQAGRSLMAASAAAPAPQEAAPVPAAYMGTEASPYDTRFPGAIPQRLGVMGPEGPYAGEQYPRPY